MVRDEGVIGEHGPGRNNFRAGNNQTLVGFLLYMNANVRDLVGRLVAVHRRVNDSVIDERDTLLAELVPASRVLLVWLVEFRIGAERRQERGLVIGRASNPAIDDASPLRNRVPAGY